MRLPSVQNLMWKRSVLFRASSMLALLTRNPLREMRAHVMANDMRAMGCVNDIPHAHDWHGWVCANHGSCVGEAFPVSYYEGVPTDCMSLHLPSSYLLNKRHTSGLDTCTLPQHLSYFMPSEMIVGKLRGWGGFLWASVPGQPAFDIVSRDGSTGGASADRNLSFWASTCKPLYGGQVLASNNRFAFYDGKLPPLLTMLPTHPAAKKASDFTLKELEKERSILVKNVREYNATGAQREHYA